MLTDSCYASDWVANYMRARDEAGSSEAVGAKVVHGKVCGQRALTRSGW